MWNTSRTFAKYISCHILSFPGGESHKPRQKALIPIARNLENSESCWWMLPYDLLNHSDSVDYNLWIVTMIVMTEFVVVSFDRRFVKCFCPHHDMPRPSLLHISFFTVTDFAVSLHGRCSGLQPRCNNGVFLSICRHSWRLSLKDSTGPQV